MNERRIERVGVRLARETVALPWASRVELLDKMRHLDSLRPAVAKFEAVGTSQPVTLTLEEKGALLEVVEVWLREVGKSGLPEGVFALRNELHNDLHDAREREGKAS